MTHQEILTKAVDQAIAGGWKPVYNDIDYTATKREIGPSDVTLIASNRSVYLDYPRLIFNHDFAKALWQPGTEHSHNCLEQVELHSQDSRRHLYPEFWHLTQMVKAEDPIAYLGEHLEN